MACTVMGSLYRHVLFQIQYQGTWQMLAEHACKMQMLKGSFQESGRPCQEAFGKYLSGHHLDGSNESVGEPCRIELAEAEGVVVNEICHDRGRQCKQAPTKLGGSLEDGSQALVQCS